jgi:hypothetical protein
MNRKAYYPSIFIIIILLFVGCRTADGPRFDPVVNYNGEDTLAFIYRPTITSGELAPDIIIDDKKVVDLKSIGYTKVLLKQGPHTLQVKSSGLFKSTGLLKIKDTVYEFTIPANKKRCFIRIAMQERQRSTSKEKFITALIINTVFSLATKTYTPLITPTGEPHPTFVVDFMDETFALEEIQQCKYIYPEVDSL